MALTRKFLQALGIEDSKIDEIIEQHVAVKDELNKQIADLKIEAAKVPELEKQVKDFENKSDSSDELEKVKSEFEEYKKQVAAEKVTTSKKAQLKSLLTELGINEKVLDKVVSMTDIEKLELDDEGKIKDSDKLSETLKNDWSDFITKTDEKGTTPTNPPAANGKEKDYSNMSMEEYIAARSKE